MTNSSQGERSAEYESWLDEAKKASEARYQALLANPDGGIHYKPHPLMVNSGQFWRCKHGSAPTGSCWRCMVRHPIHFLRWHGVLK